MKVSEYITDYLLKHEINQCFSVTGGFAMHMNDSFGQHMNVMYTHGESPAGYAAIGYSSMEYTPSVCCVTSGCGATNAVTPCMIAYQDSVPVFFISGQVHKDFNIRMFKSKNQSVRGYFGSDVDIVSMVQPITKYSYELWNPSELLTVLDECLYNLTNGRLGPVWLSIPVDVQTMQVPDLLVSTFIKPVPPVTVLSQEFIDTWSKATRPLVLAGNGIHTAKCVDAFNSFLDKHRVPSVVSFFGIDLNDTYIGKVGLIGNRAGNFAIQNCDVLMCLGCRLSRSITGYNRDLFAPDCKIIYVDIDPTEFLSEKKTTLNVCMDLRDFFAQDVPQCTIDPEWLRRTDEWRKNWNYEVPSHDSDNPYPITKRFFEEKPCKSVSVASSGSLYCVVWHMFKCKHGDRFITSGHGDMGYEVPVAIGASLHGKTVFSFVGDGSFQLNLQELQTIKTYNLPVVIMYYDNGGYGAIQITQQTVFKREYGTSASCGLECPDIKKIAAAYDLPYHLATKHTDYATIKGPAIVHVVCKVQERTPKISNKLMPDGTFVNLPYEDMFPFLDRDVLGSNMFRA
jgi:acetolactate synthase-1/2/3 large subunit